MKFFDTQKNYYQYVKIISSGALVFSCVALLTGKSKKEEVKEVKVESRVKTRKTKKKSARKR